MGRLVDHAKQHGVHYTPPELATFLARATFAATRERHSFQTIDVLDPACGDGALLRAFAESVPQDTRKCLNLCGYEQDSTAAEKARSTLKRLDVQSVDIQQADFLETATVLARRGRERQFDFFDHEPPSKKQFDFVIANPPYVRTQVLGARKAQALGERFGLSGRVDLYHAFSIAMANALRTGGVLGLLTSNRFLTVKSGVSLRRFLREQFNIRSVFDLGDTKLFQAAVLPAIVIAEKREHPNGTENCRFSRVYEHRLDQRQNAVQFEHILDAIEDPRFTGFAQTRSGSYYVEKGVLTRSSQDEIWSLSTPDNSEWLGTVTRNSSHTFDDVAQIRVGIKTTADSVFIRREWDSLEERHRPEESIVFPLITHHCAARWTPDLESNRLTVLYPYDMSDVKRKPIDLSRFPRAAAYLDLHAARLKSRRYVVEGGRQWYEIWVPHSPQDWTKKKIVFPDIAETPTFFMDESGTIVNGDCYWITLRPGIHPDWLYLILAVGNSTFATEYYDVRFHNKLYAGRRRFMTQYVKQFPLPELQSETAQRIVAGAKKLLRQSEHEKRGVLEKELDRLVWRSLGFSKEIARQGAAANSSQPLKERQESSPVVNTTSSIVTPPLLFVDRQ